MKNNQEIISIQVGYKQTLEVTPTELTVLSTFSGLMLIAMLIISLSFKIDK